MNGHGSPNFMRALSDFRHFFCCGCCCCHSLVCEFIIVWTFVAKRRSSGKAHAQQQHRAKNEIFSGFLCENKCLATISDMPHEPPDESARSQFISALYYSWMFGGGGWHMPKMSKLLRPENAIAILHTDADSERLDHMCATQCHERM